MAQALNIINSVINGNHNRADLEQEFTVTVTQAEINALNEAIKDVFPAHTQLTEDSVNDRAALQAQAQKVLLDTALANYGQTSAYPELGSAKRDISRILLPVEEHPENQVKNDETVRIITKGTPNEKHRLLLDVMNEMASVPVEQFKNADDGEMLELFGKHCRALMIGFEGENIIKDFKNFGFPISPEEEKHFQNLRKNLNDITFAVSVRMDEIFNPFYPAVDLSAIKLEDLSKQEELEDAARTVSEDAVSHIGNHFLVTDLKRKERLNQINEILSAYGENTDDLTITNQPHYPMPNERNENTINYKNGGFEKDLRAGKPIYVYGVKDGQPGAMRVFQDLNGDGILREVPAPVKKPGLFAKMADGIMKFFGSKNGYRPCRDFEAYEAKIEELKATPVTDMDQVRMKEAKQFVTSAIRQDDQIKQSLAELQSTENKIQTITAQADTIIDEMMGPDAQGSKLLLEGNHYKPTQYTPTKLEFPQNTGLDKHQLSVVAMCCLSDPAIMETFAHRNPLLTPEEDAACNFTFSTTDIFVTKRASLIRGMSLLNPAREKAVEYLNAFENGHPEQLGKILGCAFRNFQHSITSRPDITAESVANSDLQQEILGILNSNPELSKAAGLTKDDMDMYRANRFRTSAYKDYVAARKTLTEAVIQGKELPQEQKISLLTDISLYQTIESINTIAIDRIQTSEPFQAAVGQHALLSVDIFNREQALSNAQNNDSVSPEEKTRLQKQYQETVNKRDKYVFQEEVMITTRPVSGVDRILGAPNSIESKKQGLKQLLQVQSSFRDLAQMSTEELNRISHDKQEFAKKSMDMVKEITSTIPNKPQTNDHSRIHEAPELQNRPHLSPL